MRVVDPRKSFTGIPVATKKFKQPPIGVLVQTLPARPWSLHSAADRTLFVRVVAAILAMLMLAVTFVVMTSPSASAATPVPKFRIYYSPDCTNAYRTYTGSTSGKHTEYWINDRFNAPQPGASGSTSRPGLGQLIRGNAASIRVYASTSVIVYRHDPIGRVGQYFERSSSTGSRCFNFDDYPANGVDGLSMRNRNTQFAMWPYSKSPNRG